jgi:hypothetical protein
MECGEEKEELVVGASIFPRCCGSFMQKIPSRFAFKLPGKFNPKTDVELDDFLTQHGEAPVFQDDEHKEKAKWAVKKARMGDDHLTF